MTILIIITIIIIIMNKGNRGEKESERDWERVIMYYYNTVTSKISNVVIFTNHVLSAYILHKAKIQHYFVVFVITRKSAELLLTIEGCYFLS